MPELAMNGAKPVRERPFHRWPLGDPSDVEAVAKAILSGEWYADRTPNVLALEQQFAAKQGARFGVACNGGTTALQVALEAAGIVPGDEVVVPTYTYIATAHAVLRVGAVPVFCDVEADTFNIDVGSAEAAITEHTAAIMPVHWGGRGVDMDAVLALAKKRNLKVIEDACHGWGGSWRGRGLGSFGLAAGFSFQASKNLTGGEGGFVTTDDEEVAELARLIRRGGHGEREGKLPVFGSNYRMSEIVAALLLNQLSRLDEQNRTRMGNAGYLSAGLSRIPGLRALRSDPKVTVNTNYQYLFRYDRVGFDGLPRESFVDAMRAEGVPVGLGYKAPLQDFEFFARIPATLPGGHPFTCGCYKGSADYGKMRTPVAERLCKEEALTLAGSVFLGPRSDMDDILAAAVKVRKNVAELLAVKAT